MDKIIVHEFETMESESPRLRPCLLRKAVRGREATLPAESTLVSVYMRKKLTPLPEPTVLEHTSLSETVSVHALIVPPWMSWPGCTSQVLYWEKLACQEGYLSNTEAYFFSHVNGSPCFASLWLGNVWKVGLPRVVTFLLVCLFVCVWIIAFVTSTCRYLITFVMKC